MTVDVGRWRCQYIDSRIRGWIVSARCYREVHVEGGYFERKIEYSISTVFNHNEFIRAAGLSSARWHEIKPKILRLAKLRACQQELV